MPKKKQVKDNSQPPRAKPEKIGVLIYCPSDLILTGILKAFEPDRSIEIIAVEKGTIESLMEAIKQL
ncbi:MAG TPA: hypothetical protein PLW38_02525, partial [Candidatus Saccharicenans sp.]|nr:hypothetical protein [Candidatus Saccharicenans sp.]